VKKKRKKIALSDSEKNKTKLHLVAVRKKEEKKVALDYTEKKIEESGIAVGNLKGKGERSEKKRGKKSALGYVEKKHRRVRLQWRS